MKTSRNILAVATVFALVAPFAASAQIYGDVNANITTSVVNASATAEFQGSSSTTRAEMRTKASSTRAANMEARQANMMQREMTTADTEITNRINSLNNLIAKVNAMAKVSSSDKASITATIQAEINAMTSLKAKVDADTGTTTLRTDLKSITGDYRVYALVEPQIAILAAADRINQIVSLMTTVETKINARIAALQSAGIDVSAFASTTADISAKLGDAGVQSSAAVSATASLTPDQGNATVAASNAAALKTGRADIKAGNADLQAVRRDMEAAIIGIRKITPRGGLHATTTASTTVNQ
ncbi:MAG: hypothetical protein KGH93_02015 [Patescibacteria group bacterium]|nr:hypothetical protein [Patescibacteria group bacterium]MDE1945954.1 hypothetical protein [Patescibacteria group bacterium]